MAQKKNRQWVLAAYNNQLSNRKPKMLKPKLPNNSLPVICGIEITTDAEGRFNLNALHKASGKAEEKAQASGFVARQQKS